jgi:cytochrome c
MPAITKEKSIVLRSPTVVVASGDLSDGVSRQSVEQMPVPLAIVNRAGSSVSFKQIDLTAIGAVTLMVAAPAQYQAKGGKIELHADSPTGALLGESDAITPTADQTPLRLRVALKPTSGVHDLYLVFRNPDVTTDQFLFAVLTATFSPN